MALASSWRYQVFLSFRGEDTRKTFIGHLYDKLTTKGIYTFRDDKELPRGKFISHELRETIRDSRISIVLLSENYASSSWCLEELREIIKCNKEMGQIVIPIFYKVDPSDVKKIRKSFAEAFEKHEENFGGGKEKVEAWKEALAKLGSISGWHLQDRDEASFIGLVVADILDKLSVSCSTSIDASGLVGMDSHVREMEQLLCIGSNVIRMVGVWGKGGIGKTTIARVVYGKLCTRFGASWFLEDVASKFKKNGAAALKEELLSNILRERDLKGWHLDKYSTVIKDRLGKRNVLIVLDNVDHLEQLEVLAKSAGWFGPGSRIIITTRDKRVLEQHRVKFIYDTKNLDDDAALQLFSRYAFKQNQPKSNYTEMSNAFVTYAKGLPLALKVLGSSLYDRSLHQWQQELDKLGNQNPELHNLLKISYDGLKRNEKEVFLDIACFFNGEDKDRVGDILDACGFSPDSAFEVLMNKALLNIVNDKLYIDELLRDMASEIVQQESEVLGERSRLWDSEDINLVLSDCVGTGHVKGIFLEMPTSSESNDMQLRCRSFNGMSNLRLLKMNNPSCNLQLSNASFEYLSAQLRYLHWYAYPSKLWVPSSAGYLVELYLPHSDIENLWAGKQYLAYLKLIDLSQSKLINLPDLSEAKKLKHLNLQGCTDLVEIQSLQFLTELEYVNLSSCSNLKDLSELPISIKYLFLAETALEKLPESLGFLSDCKTLDISNCTRLWKLPSNFDKLCSAGYINIAGSPHLLKLLSNKGSSNLFPMCFSDTSPGGNSNKCTAPEGASNCESPPNFVLNSKLGSKRTKEHEELEATAAPLRQCIRHSGLGQDVDGSNFNKTAFEVMRTSSASEVDTKSAPISQTEESTTLQAVCKPLPILLPHQTETQLLEGVNETSNMQYLLSEEKEAVTEPVFLPPIGETFQTTEIKGPLTLPIVAEASVIAEFQIATTPWTLSANGARSKFSAQSTSSLQIMSKNLLAQLLSRKGTQISCLNGDVEAPTVAVDPELLMKQKNELAAYFSMSVEAIHEADAFNNIEQIALTLRQHSSYFSDKAGVNYVLPLVREFNASIPDIIKRMKTANDLKTTIPEKSKDLDASLDKGEEQLSSLIGEHDKISEEQDKVADDIQRLMAKQRALLDAKHLVASQLEEVNAKLLKDLKEREHLQADIKQADNIIYEEKEKLDVANTRWKCLGNRIRAVNCNDGVGR